MELEEKQNRAPGYIPEFGAIFMSNSATKKECFRRKLLGLPSSQAHFVKQVKVGMLLFLFEFERRELHGVFQASSNGAMNIVPNAYSSSGKQYPAQVKFTPLWHCDPLSEDEFSDAIQENYYAAKKFNFGLSEDQVSKLLYLFSLRKLKPQRQFSRYKVATVRRAANDESCMMSNQVEDEHDVDSSSGSVISIVHNQLRSSSAFDCSMVPQVSNFVCPKSSGDASPYNLDAPRIDMRHLLSHNFASPLNSGFGYSAPVPSSDQYENSRRARMPLLEVAYSENMDPVCLSDAGDIGRINEGPSHFLSPSHIPRYIDGGPSHLLSPSHIPRCIDGAPSHLLTSSHIPRCIDGGPSHLLTSSHIPRCIDEGPSPLLSPSHIPSFALDSGYCEASQENRDHEMPQCGINLACTANVPLLKESQSQPQDHLFSVKFKRPDHHVNSSLTPDVYPNSGSLYSDCSKKRESVFSRLAFAPTASVKENDTLVSDVEDTNHTSVNEVMSMLYQSHYQWLKMRKSRQSMKENATDFGRRRQATFNTQSSKDRFQKISKEVKVNDVPASEESGDQLVEKTSFGDFRRRSEVRKTHNNNDIDTGSCNGIKESQASAGVPHKRRKLIRPDFSKNELPNDKSISINNPQNVVLLHELSQISHADKNVIEVEIVSDCKGEEMGETYIAPSICIDEDGKESSQNVGIGTMPSSISCEDMSNIAEQDVIIKDGKESSQNVGIRAMPSSISCEDASNIAEQVLIIKESMVDRLPQDISNISHCIGQEASLETCKTDANGVTSGEFECCRGNEKGICPNVNIDSEIAIGPVDESSNQNPKSEMALNELVAAGCEGCKIDFQQNENDNEVLSSSCENVGNGRQSRETRTQGSLSQELANISVNNEGKGN